MPRTYHSPMRDLIIESIREAGPMSSAQLVEYTGKSRRSIDSAVHFARFGPQGKLLYIKSHIRNIGTGGKSAPVYAIGHKTDKSEPPSDRKADRRRYYQKMRPVVLLKQKRRNGLAVDPWLQLLAA